MELLSIKKQREIIKKIMPKAKFSRPEKGLMLVTNHLFPVYRVFELAKTGININYVFPNNHFEICFNVQVKHKNKIK